MFIDVFFNRSIFEIEILLSLTEFHFSMSGVLCVTELKIFVQGKNIVYFISVIFLLLIVDMEQSDNQTLFYELT